MKNNIKDRCCGNGNIVEEFLMDRNNPNIMKCVCGRVDTDNIFIGAGERSYYEEEKQIVGEGLIAIENIANAYELVNLGKTNIYLNSPDLKNISSGSYFTNPIVTILIEYKGRQGA